MKFLMFLIVLFACFLADATNVQFNLADPQFGISQTTNVEIVLQQESAGGLNSSVVLLPFKLYGWTDTNGSCTFLNLNGSPISGYYHWTVPANSNPQGNGPSATVSGDIWVQSTNFATVLAPQIAVVYGASTYPSSAWAWSAFSSDLRYTASAQNLTNFVLIGTLLSTSNSIVSQIPSTNGFVTSSITNGLAPISYVQSSTNGFVTSAITNGLATLTYVQNATNGLVGNSVTNGFAPISYVAAQIQIATNGLANTNYVNAATNGLVTSAVTNGLAPLSYVIAATNQLANTNTLLNYTLLTAYNAGTNSVSTAAANALIATNVSLVANIAAQITTVNSTVSNATNGLNNAKQPSSLILTNLALTGALTNALAAGQNFSLTTNFSGNTIILNATNQTFLTNGLAVWSTVVPSSYLLTNSLPALTNGFVTQSITNGLASISYVQSSTNGFVSSSITNGLASVAYVQASTNGFISASITNGFAPISYVVTATNGLATTNFVLTQIAGINTNYATLANVSSTNLTALISVTNQIVSATNQLASTSFVASAIAPYATTNQFWFGTNWINTNLLSQISATNTANLVIDTNLVLAATDGLASTNWTLTQIASSNTANLIVTTNLVVASTNGGNIVFNNNPQFSLALTNPASFVATTSGQATNLAVQNYFIFGTKTNFVWTTNVVGVVGAGSPFVDGTYVGQFGLYTNPFESFMTVLWSAGNLYLQSNGVALYQSVDAQNWTIVNGLFPAPHGSYGHYDYDNGSEYLGWFHSTNITWQITNSIGLLTPFVVTNVVNGMSLITSNQTLNLIYQYGVNPTNGITAATATNITKYLISQTNLNVTLPEIAAAQMVFAGTNNPNGTVTATYGAIYNQFSVSNTNLFLYQRINTNGSTGWF